MTYQNITLSIPKDILQRAKIMAVQKQTSLSKLLSDALVAIVTQEDQYTLAMRRQMAMMEEGVDLGMPAKPTWTRDELHER